MPTLKQMMGSSFNTFFDDVTCEFPFEPVEDIPDTRTDEEIARDEVQAELNWKHSQV